MRHRGNVLVSEGQVTHHHQSFIIWGMYCQGVPNPSRGGLNLGGSLWCFLGVLGTIKWRFGLWRCAWASKALFGVLGPEPLADRLYLTFGVVFGLRTLARFLGLMTPEVIFGRWSPS